MNTQPVLIINEDADDREFIQDAWKELKYPNELIFFKDGEEAFYFLKTDKTVPFLILCDVNLPKMDGFALKEKLQEQNPVRYKSIPFVFWSTKVSNSQIQKAYDLGVNGFFVKENSFSGLKKSLTDIVNYWAKSVVPE